MPPLEPAADLDTQGRLYWPIFPNHGMIISEVPLLKILRPLFVDPSESKQIDHPDIIDKPMPVTERPPSTLSAAAEPAKHAGA